MTAELFIRKLEIRRDPALPNDAYPFSLAVLRNLTELAFTVPVTFLAGENGTGKSTLLEALAVSAGFNAEGGTWNMRFATRPSHSILHESIRVVRGARRPADGFFLRAESFYNVATEVDRAGVAKSYGGVSLHDQSHGEAFFSLVMHRFSKNGLYILDEPEAALSPARQLALLVRMQDLVEAGSQFIVATHSPILMGFPGAQILVLSDDGIVPVAYEETEHYMVTRRFLEDREAMLRHLLS